ncbi:MAG: hypothetical protein HYX35_01980 [Proteobacteria bacterium]|nr:hypothetical protein [Pseudomonadota bacterium]
MHKLLSLSFFLLLFLASTTLYGMEDCDGVACASSSTTLIPQRHFFIVPESDSPPEPLTNTASLPKVTRDEWKKIEIDFLKEAYAVMLLEPGIPPEKIEYFSTQYYNPKFSKYFEMYQMLASKNKKILKDIRKDLRTLLDPLGHFVAVFEALFDLLRTHYRINSHDYLVHKDRLENDFFPIVKRTFILFMAAYANYTPETLGDLGPLTYLSQNFSVISDKVLKHIFYKRDGSGFLLFTMFPHQKMGENLYETYLPYLTNRTPYYISDIVLFSLNSHNTPVLEKRPGLIIKRSNAGHSIEGYRGNTTSLPYTTGQEMLVGNPSTIKTITTLKEIADLKERYSQSEDGASQDEESKSVNEYLDNAYTSVSTTLPSQVKGNLIFGIVPFPHHTLVAIKGVLSTFLGNNDSTFIPFPSTPLEETEETYLFLLDLKQRLAQKDPQPEDIHLLTYLEETYFPEETIDEIVQRYEEELIDTYKAEAEQKIRLEQEERSRMVAEGSHYSSSNNSRIKGSSKKKEKSKKETSSAASNATTSTSSNNNAEEVDELTEKAYQTARKKLEVLKTVNKNGSIKYRKFMQIVNVAAQGLSNLNSKLTTQINKGSHGNIQVEGSQPQTLVRPHGSAKEKSISAKTQRKILTGLVESLMQKLANKE